MSRSVDKDVVGVPLSNPAVAAAPSIDEGKKESRARDVGRLIGGIVNFLDQNLKTTEGEWGKYNLGEKEAREIVIGYNSKHDEGFLRSWVGKMNGNQPLTQEKGDFYYNILPIERKNVRKKYVAMRYYQTSGLLTFEFRDDAGKLISFEDPSITDVEHQAMVGAIRKCVDMAKKEAKAIGEAKREAPAAVAIAPAVAVVAAPSAASAIAVRSQPPSAAERESKHQAKNGRETAGAGAEFIKNLPGFKELGLDIIRIKEVTAVEGKAVSDFNSIHKKLKYPFSSINSIQKGTGEAIKKILESDKGGINWYHMDDDAAHPHRYKGFLQKDANSQVFIIILEVSPEGITLEEEGGVFVEEARELWEKAAPAIGEVLQRIKNEVASKENKQLPEGPAIVPSAAVSRVAPVNEEKKQPEALKPSGQTPAQGLIVHFELQGFFEEEDKGTYKGRCLSTATVKSEVWNAVVRSLPSDINGVTLKRYKQGNHDVISFKLDGYSEEEKATYGIGLDNKGKIFFSPPVKKRPVNEGGDSYSFTSSHLEIAKIQNNELVLHKIFSTLACMQIKDMLGGNCEKDPKYDHLIIRNVQESSWERLSSRGDERLDITLGRAVFRISYDKDEHCLKIGPSKSVRWGPLTLSHTAALQGAKDAAELAFIKKLKEVAKSEALAPAAPAPSAMVASPAAAASPAAPSSPAASSGGNAKGIARNNKVQALVKKAVGSFVDPLAGEASPAVDHFPQIPQRGERPRMAPRPLVVVVVTPPPKKSSVKIEVVGGPSSSSSVGSSSASSSSSSSVAVLQGKEPKSKNRAARIVPFTEQSTSAGSSSSVGSSSSSSSSSNPAAPTPAVAWGEVPGIKRAGNGLAKIIEQGEQGDDLAEKVKSSRKDKGKDPADGGGCCAIM